MLGFSYKPGGFSLKSPRQVCKTKCGDCDELALLFYQVSKQLGIVKSDQLTLIIVRDKNDPIRIGHANLLLAEYNGSDYVFDLTHFPPVVKLDFRVDHEHISTDKHLLNWEFTQAIRGQPKSTAIKEPVLLVYEHPFYYYHYKLGMQLLEEKNWADAEKELLKSNPHDPDSFLSLANAQLNQGSFRWREAHVNINKAIVLSPKDLHILGISTGYLLGVGAFNQALELGMRVEKRKPNDALNLVYVATAFYRLSLVDSIDYNGSTVGVFAHPERSEIRLSHYANLLQYYGQALAVISQIKGDMKPFLDKTQSVVGQILYSYELALRGEFEKINEEELKAAKEALDPASPLLLLGDWASSEVARKKR